MGWQQAAMMLGQMAAPKVGEALGLGPDGAPAMTQPQDQSRQLAAQQSLLQAASQQPQQMAQQSPPQMQQLPPDVMQFLRQLGLM